MRTRLAATCLTWQYLPMQAKKIRFYGSNRDQIVESVGYKLLQLALAMRRETASRLLSLGLTEAQWRPLWMLKAGRADTA